MIIEKESECDFLRALLKSPQFGLPEYTADPIVQRRVGRAVAEASTQPHSRLILPRCVDALPNTTRGKKFTSPQKKKKLFFIKPTAPAASIRQRWPALI